MRRILRRLVRGQAGLPAAPASWACVEAERLLSDDDIAGPFMLGDHIDAPPEVLAEMAAIVRELERHES